ncbi:MAG TPA: cysteine desulfurase family protein [Acidimicrobiales bacterium]|nr:cysteine desulfurase family protein [Acidimicrobiales bacterium]
MARHYLDNASTVPLRPEAVIALRDWLEVGAADPGRLHQEGRVVRIGIETAREQVADLLGAQPRQVVFTASGTEAINAAVWGATRARPGAVVLCAAVEHSAVRDASARAAPNETLPVDGRGRIELDGLDAALARHASSRPALVHCQWANHEVGTVQPVREVVVRCREAGVPVHVDAASACGHLPTDLEELGADLVSVSAHKLGGPAGVGALWIRPGLRIEPLLVGGQQERARRAGFENAAAIVSFGAAAAALSADHGARLAAEALADRRLVGDLLAAATAVDGVALVGDPDPDGRVPHIVCLGVAGVEAEPVVIGLDKAGIAVHSGSACSSESLEPSPVLVAMGVDASRSLRLSVGWANTDADVAAFGRAFQEVVEGLRSLRA